MTDYEEFSPLGYDHLMDLPSSDATSHFQLRIPLYEGVPLESALPTDVIKEFCYIGKNYGTGSGVFLVLEDLLSRLDPEVRQNDYRTLYDNPNANLFHAWSGKGALIPLPSGLAVDPHKFTSVKEWDDKQLQRWINVFDEIDKSTPTSPYNVYSRFIQPDAGGFMLYFTPPPSQKPTFDVATLGAVFKAAFNDEGLKLPKYDWQVISFEEATNNNLVITGVHYLFFYVTWMTQADFIKLWNKIQNKPSLLRSWPNAELAEQIDFAIHGKKKGPRGSDVTIATMNHAKANAVTGQRPKYKGQGAVMGASATLLAEEIWGKAALTDSIPKDAEWLHRNAFHFGGTSDVIDLASSQTRENLVFGTGECNTHMIRAENTITSLLKAEALLAHDDKRSGTLTTTNVFEGSITRLDYTDGFPFWRRKEVPAWAVQQKYMWLSFGLKYEWKMSATKLNGLTFNVSHTFDPFSRYIPLRVEARLDDALMDYLTQGSLTTNSNTNKFLTSAEQTWGIASSIQMNDSTYQEPMLLWNAAKKHLPSVYVDGSRLLKPGIGQPSVADEAPSNAPPIHVIGADALFSHVTDDAPPKAIRVVEVRPPHQPVSISRTERVSAPTFSWADSAFPAALASSSPVTFPPKEGFVLVGEIYLFGQSSLRAKFEKWEGPPPPGVVVLTGNPASVESASLTDDFHLSSIVPSLEGTAFDDITFRNVTVFHQNYPFEATKGVGWHFSADLVIDGACGGLRDLLSKVLGVDEPILSVQLFLGTSGGWNELPSLNSFTLEGVFSGIACKPVDGVILSQIGIKLFGIQALKIDPKPRMALEYGFSVFGIMLLDVPGSVTPLKLDYEIQEYGGTVSLGASVDVWNNPLGVQEFTLNNTSFSASFALSSLWKSLAFGISADFKYKKIRASFEGYFAPGRSFDISAMIHNVRFDTIEALFERISNHKLSLPDVDITIGTARLSISSDKGLDIALDKVVIGDYTSVNAGLTITSHNVTLRGDLTSDVIHFGEVELKRAFLQVTLEGKGNGKNTDVIVGGEVAFSSLTFDVAAHLYRSPDSTKTLEWTVLAALTVGDTSLALSKIVPEVQGTVLDLALTQAVFVAASRDDPSLGNMITSGYSFHQGVQFCAVLSEIDDLNSLMRGPVPGLTLSAGWSKSKGFTLDVFFPTPTILNLGNGITTTPLTMSIQTKPVQLVLNAGLKVPVAHSPAPLLFSLFLNTNLMGASATGQMSGWWVNPLGISQQVKVGPNLALSVDINFAQFLSTGTPSGFAVQGGLMIGSTEAQLALSVNEDPMKELLYTEVKSLNITDVSVLASNIIGSAIPEPPRDFLDFKEVKLHICPAGVTIGSTVYPQGLSFQADMIIFGKRADIKCVVEPTQLTIKGGVDNFTLGPLTVRGTTGPRAVVECEIGLATQHLLIDGVISLFEAESAVKVEIDILPSPKFKFFTKLKFTDLLYFQLTASLEGSINFKDLSDADFLFDAILEQHILQYVHDQVLLQFDQARRAADTSIDAAQKAVDNAGNDWRAAVDREQAKLDAAQKTWDEKNRNVTMESNQVIDAYNEELNCLQSDITNAQNTYDAAMLSAENAVNAANRSRAQAMQDAQHGVDNAERAAVDALNQAQGEVDRAERAFNDAFGSAQAKIDSAIRDVESLRNQINDVKSKIREYEDASWREFWKKGAIAGLYVAVGTLETSKITAEGALHVAKAVLTSTSYVSSLAAFKTAEGALEATKVLTRGSILVAKGALQTADDTSRIAVTGAEKTLTLTRIGVEYGALQLAKEALRVFQATSGPAFRAATEALVALATCVEFLAYQAAKTALSIARDASVTLEGAKAALELARVAGKEALDIGQWVAARALRLFDLRVIHLSGSLRGMVGAGGKLSKPFTARIEWVMADQPFSINATFSPGMPAELITIIFKQIWNDIKVGMLKGPLIDL